MISDPPVLHTGGRGLLGTSCRILVVMPKGLGKGSSATAGTGCCGTGG